MGWCDDSGEHEGWVQGIFSDGELSTGTTNGEGVCFDIQPDGKYARIRPTSEIVALRMKCECGWAGDPLPVASLAPRYLDSRWNEPTEEGEEVLFLPAWRAHVRPFNHTNELRRLGFQLDEVQAKIEDEVTAARSAGATWESIGRAIGISRQAAQQRFGG